MKVSIKSYVVVILANIYVQDKVIFVEVEYVQKNTRPIDMIYVYTRHTRPIHILDTYIISPFTFQLLIHFNPPIMMNSQNTQD